jgi:hypothetical protein
MGCRRLSLDRRIGHEFNNQRNFGYFKYSRFQPDESGLWQYFSVKAGDSNRSYTTKVCLRRLTKSDLNREVLRDLGNSPPSTVFSPLRTFTTMTIDIQPSRSFQPIEIDRNLPLDRDMDDRSQFIDPHNVLSLDDESIIRRFARGKKRLVSNQYLRVDYAHNSLQLATAGGDLIAIHKIAERLHYILVKKDNEYADLIHALILEYQFIPIDHTTVDRRFVRYQKYDVPEGYELRYDLGDELWQAWQENQQQFTVGLRLDILILAKSKWYRVQDLHQNDERLDIQTRLGIISVSPRDPIAWVAKLSDMPSNRNIDNMKVSMERQNVSNHDTDSDILAKIISKLSIDSAPSNEDIHFDLETIVSTPFIAETSESSLLYDPDRSSMLTSNNTSSALESLMTAAIKVLEDYLENGETIVRTEIITDAQGNTIGEKSITIKRGCPKWAIEAVLDWE